MTNEAYQLAEDSLWPLTWASHMSLTHLPLDKMAIILADDTFKCIFLNENDRIPITISLNVVSNGPINNIPALV